METKEVQGVLASAIAAAEGEKVLLETEIQCLERRVKDATDYLKDLAMSCAAECAKHKAKIEAIDKDLAVLKGLV